MKNHFLLAIFCCCVFSTKAQDTLPEPNYLSIIAYWKLGDTLKYERTKGEKNYKDGVLQDSTETIDKLALVVADSTDSTYVIRIFFRSNPVQKILDAGLTGKDVLQAMAVSEYAQLEYVTDEYGSLLRFNNLDKFHRAYTLFLDSLYARKQAASGQKAEKSGTLEKLKSRPAFEALFLNEIRILHKFYGFRFAQDSFRQLVYQIVNPLNTKDTLLLTNNVIVTIPEEWNGLVKLRNLIVVRDEVAISLVSGLFEETPNFTEMQRGLLEKSPKVDFYTGYAFYPGTGVLASMYYTTNVYLENKLVKETYVHLSLVRE